MEQCTAETGLQRNSVTQSSRDGLLACFPESKTGSYAIFAPKDTYFFTCIAALTLFELTFL